MNMKERPVNGAVVLLLDGDLTMGDAGTCQLANRVRRLIQAGHLRIVLDVGLVPPRGLVVGRWLC
jgi:hypothetical protein